jgi:hypothetical protein
MAAALVSSVSLSLGNSVKAAKFTPEQKISIKDVNGNISSTGYVTVHPVPADWNPLTATDEELSYYGYPKRPTNENQLKEWQKHVSGKWIKPDFQETNIERKVPKRTTNATGGPSFSTNWAGYAVESQCNEVVGGWYVPSVSADSNHLPAYSCQWVGLGAYDGNPTLLQAGTEADVNSSGNTNYYPWYELLGTSYYSPFEVKVNNLPISPGDDFYVQITTTPAVGYTWVNFYLNNNAKHENTSFSVAIGTPSIMPNSAEWVSERPLVNSSFPNYPITTDIITHKEATVFTDSAYQISSNNYLQYANGSDPNMNKVTMFGSNTIATPESLSTGNFDVLWDAYQ